jgi:hypothetical protein
VTITKCVVGGLFPLFCVIKRKGPGLFFASMAAQMLPRPDLLSPQAIDKSASLARRRFLPVSSGNIWYHLPAQRRLLSGDGEPPFSWGAKEFIELSSPGLTAEIEKLHRANYAFGQPVFVSSYLNKRTAEAALWIGAAMAFGIWARANYAVDPSCSYS